jgi:hypothetical protein
MCVGMNTRQVCWDFSVWIYSFRLITDDNMMIQLVLILLSVTAVIVRVSNFWYISKFSLSSISKFNFPSISKFNFTSIARLQSSIFNQTLNVLLFSGWLRRYTMSLCMSKHERLSIKWYIGRRQSTILYTNKYYGWKLVNIQ